MATTELGCQQANDRIRAPNDALQPAMQEQAQQIDAELDQAGLLYSERFAQQFPRDYAYSDTVAFCLKAIENHRAESIGHALNLYEDALHQRRIEKNQEVMLAEQVRTRQQQAVGIVLNTFMQGATINAIRSEGAAIRSRMY